MPLYHGNYGPVREMQDGVMLRGWTEQEYVGKEISIDGTYRDNLSVVLKGEHSQESNSGANLLPFPYSEMYVESNGVVYDVQEDGGIAVSGTPTGYSFIRLCNNLALNQDKITISISGDYVNVMLNYTVKDGSGTTLANASIDSVTGKTYATIDLVNDYPEAKTLDILIKRRNNSMCSGVMYVMLNVGDSSLEYEPYSPSRNLINPHDALLGTVVDNGVTRLSVWGSAVLNNAWVLANLKPSTTYYVKARIRIVSRPETHTKQGSPLKGLTLFSSGDKTLYPSMNLVYSYDIPDVGGEIVINNTIVTPATLHDETSRYSIIGYSERWLSEEDSSAKLGTVDFLDLIISEVDVPYSQYGATVTSPSIHCPSDILPLEEPVVTIGGIDNELGVVLYGNGTVFDTFENDITITRPRENILPFPYTVNDKEEAGTTLTVQDDGGVRVSGVSTGYFVANLYNGALLTTGTMTYSLQGEFAGMVGIILLYAGSETIATLTLNESSGYSYTVDFADYPTADRIVIRLRRDVNGVATEGIIYPMINIGEEALPYEKYGETVSERYSRLNKTWCEVTFDGAEKWFANGEVDELCRYYPSITNYDRTVTGLCTHLPKASSTNKLGVYFGSSVNFIVEKDKYPDLDSWVAYVTSQYEAGTPVKLLYKFLEPVISLADPVPLYTTPKHTDISCDAEITTKIKTVEK